MTMDPISDMLTTIRNGQKARLHSVATPASNLKGEIARVMKESGYIADAVTTTEFPKKLVITLKYSDKAGHGARHPLDLQGRHERRPGQEGEARRRGNLHSCIIRSQRQCLESVKNPSSSPKA